MAGFLSGWLAHPLTRDVDIDDPEITALRAQIIHTKPFLQKIYAEWYSRIATSFTPDDQVLELGSGAGFLKQVMPRVMTSEVFFTPKTDMVSDALAIPLGHAAIDGIVMTDVLHHIPDCDMFLREAARVVRPGGRIVMIEPWVTPWSAWVYTHLHHEPFAPDAAKWQLRGAGPLSRANGALPWILFHRDRPEFERRHPLWRIGKIVPIMPVAYVLSGGISLRWGLPGWMYRPVRFFERCTREKAWAMFALITLERLP